MILTTRFNGYTGIVFLPGGLGAFGRAGAWAAALLGLLLCAAPLMGAEVQKEAWADGASSASEAFARYAPKRIGLLLSAVDGKPGMRFRYAGRALLTEKQEFASSAHRMPVEYELRLYEVLRGAFRERGYEVRCLNRSPWEGLRLREIVAQTEGVDAVCVTHYSIQRTRAALDREGYTWWTPFEKMRLTVRCVVYDVSSGDRIYEMEGETLGTEAIYSRLGDLVKEEPLYPKGYDRYGKISPYKIAIYNTSVRDLKTGKRVVPMIRTAEGALDISIIPHRRAARGKTVLKPGTEGNIDLSLQKGSGSGQGSVLNRLLDYVSYRSRGSDVEVFDLLTIEQYGDMMRERIPERHP